MQKTYQKDNVYQATLKRCDYIFKEFEHVTVAFSGGKDSGVMLNIVYDYAKEHKLLNKLSMYHLDYEAQYQYTTDYVTDCFSKYDGIDKYWLCLPISAQCAVNIDDTYWIPWDKDKQDIWVRQLPKSKYLITEDNVPFKFKKASIDYDVQSDFCNWVAQEKGKTAVMIGIRTDESLNRFRAIASDKKTNIYKGKKYITKIGDAYNCYPIYDWGVDDVWIANAKFGYTYNKLYDLFYKAGLKPHQMRVASPFNDCAVSSLKLYKVVEPTIWSKLVGRVNGVNFAGLYGGTTAMGWKSIKLPKGHTWKSYLEFLLSTLPKDTRNNYIKKMEASKKSWVKGGAVDSQTIKELEQENAPMTRTGKTNNRGNKDKEVIQFDDYLDDTNVTDFKRIPTYKRMCICIMKNDHLCKYMGFAPTKIEIEKRKNTIAKYKAIAEGKV